MRVRLITEDIRRTPVPLTYDGNIEVLGTVRSGAHLKVAGDVTIYGNVEDAVIEADGDVTIDGGFLGSGHGQITCDGNFRCRFIQNQRVICKGGVTVERSVLSSMIFSSGGVSVAGAIVGGEIHAFEKVEVAVVGSKRPVMTRIETGVDPVIALKVEELEGEAMTLTRKRLSLLKNLKALSCGACDPRRIEMATDLEAAADAIHGDIISIGERIIKLRQKARLNCEARVVIYERCYPPVELSICFAQMSIEDETAGLEFSIRNGDIVCKPHHRSGSDGNR